MTLNHNLVDLDLPSAIPVPVEEGGTNAITPAGARTSIGAAADADLTTHTGAASPHAGHALDADLTAHTVAAAPHAGHALDADLTTHTTAVPQHTSPLAGSLPQNADWDAVAAGTVFQDYVSKLCKILSVKVKVQTGAAAPGSVLFDVLVGGVSVLTAQVDCEADLTPGDWYTASVKSDGTEDLAVDTKIRVQWTTDTLGVTQFPDGLDFDIQIGAQ